MKKTFYFNIFALIFSLIIISFFNYKIDPSKLFSNDYTKIAKRFSEGNNIELKSNINERILKKELINELLNPVDILILGSSRSMIINKELFPNKKIFNASVSGAGLEDQMIMLDIYLKKFGMPQEIILCIDPWIFNYESDTRYKQLETNYLNLKTKLSLVAKSTISNNNEYKKLLEFTYLKDSLKTFKKQNFKLNNQFYNLISDEKIYQAQGNVITTNDASLVYSKIYREKNNGEKWKDGIHYQLTNFEEINSELKKEFEILINYLKEQDVKITFFLSPYNPLLYTEYEKNYFSYFKVINEVENYIKKNFKDISIVGSYKPVNLKQTDFYDGIHLKREKINTLFSK